MTNWDEFKSDDLRRIKRKINYKYYRALILTLIYSIPLAFISPYIPGKRNGPLIETMSYWGAVLTFMIYWGIMLIMVVVYNLIRAKKDYERINPHLKIISKSDVIKRIRTPCFEEIYKQIYFKSIGDYLIDRDLLGDLETGEMVEIRIEINSTAVLSIRKLT